MNLRIAKVLQHDDVFIKKRADISKHTTERFQAIEPIAMHPDKYLYLVARAVSGGEYHGPNDNGDYFEWDELLKRYNTFHGAAVNVDHKNNKKEWAVGLIVDAVPNMEGHWVEIVMAIDKDKAEQVFPGLINDIELGVVTDVSMGCLVDESICSVCLHEAGGDIDQLSKGRGIATDPEDFCPHVTEDHPQFCKGGEHNGIPCFEINRGVTFFEESIITTKGADPDAKILARLASLREASPLDSYINFRVLDKIRVANFLKAKGDNTMSQDKKKKTAAVDTQNEKPDYGAASEKDKALFDQSKKKSDGDKDRGSQVSTKEGRGEYLLAALRNASPERKAAIAALLEIKAEDFDGDDKKENEESETSDDDGEMADGPQEPQMGDDVGEEPAAVANGEEEFEDDEEESPPVVPATAAKKGKKGNMQSSIPGKQQQSIVAKAASS